jgi:UDP-2,3-diacylglucosamine hydrolase
MRLLVVSDLHVHGPEDPLYRSLLKLLRERAQPGDIVVLAGDLFDLFVGNKRVFTDRYREFTDALREAGARGVELHYIEGNHDFHIRRAFAGIPKLRVHPHDIEFRLGGKRVFVAHGDTVDREDYGYRLLRGLFRSPLMKAFVTVAPDRWIEGIGTHSADASRKRGPRLPSQMRADRVERIRRVFRNFAAEKLTEGFDYVVLGHCHDLDEMAFQVAGRLGQYINVGYPRAHGSYLAWSPGEARITREPMP